MSRTLLADALRARHFFPMAPRKQRASQALKYAKALRTLGNNWLMAHPAAKLEQERYA